MFPSLTDRWLKSFLVCKTKILKIVFVQYSKKLTLINTYKTSHLPPLKLCTMDLLLPNKWINNLDYPLLSSSAMEMNVPSAFHVQMLKKTPVNLQKARRKQSAWITGLTVYIYIPSSPTANKSRSQSMSYFGIHEDHRQSLCIQRRS